MKKCLTLIIILVAGYFALDKFYPQIFQKIPLVKQEKTNETTNFTSSEIEGWKTYRNEEYGFEVKYPENWVNADTSELIEAKFKLLQIGFGPSQTNLLVSVFVGEGGFNNISNYIPMLKAGFKKIGESDDSLLGGKPAFHYLVQNVSTGEVCGLSTSKEERDTLNFTFSMCPLDASIFDKMLPTLKFIK